ncbi:MAG: hypothetical protein ACJA2S_004884 [Cyclobacteriaceae bacterium]|jgi:hypothetical protein
MRSKTLHVLLYILSVQLIISCSSKREVNDTEILKVIKSVVDRRLDINKKLSERELEEYVKKELQLLRNEFYARRGY